ncbi:MAG: hypothetical protein GY807_00090, partial [Gammaproteobacteria bacterium]|nr:hypothetical protein [Gammaproteobacteria bacterium]
MKWNLDIPEPIAAKYSKETLGPSIIGFLETLFANDHCHPEGMPGMFRDYFLKLAREGYGLMEHAYDWTEEQFKELADTLWKT